MTFREAERIFIDSLSSVYDRQEASSLSWLSISFVCKLERVEYLNLKDTKIPSNKVKALFEVLEQLKTGKPLQYILGETEFYGLNFKVNPSVLIPRPETEELVEWIISDIRSSISSLEGLKIIDIGTGSACIPVSIKKQIPWAEVYAVDISANALNTGRKNAVLNHVDVVFIQDDILSPVNNELIHTKYRIIVSNPPYITVAEKDQMLPNVLEHEPHL
ncbi:MAG: HemK/PrmC family methyltransferase, partial [Pedobacter sp.]